MSVAEDKKPGAGLRVEEVTDQLESVALNDLDERRSKQPSENFEVENLQAFFSSRFSEAKSLSKRSREKKSKRRIRKQSSTVPGQPNEAGCAGTNQTDLWIVIDDYETLVGGWYFPLIVGSCCAPHAGAGNKLLQNIQQRDSGSPNKSWFRNSNMI